MENILKKICEEKKYEIEMQKQKCSFNSLEKLYTKKNNRKFKELLKTSQKNKKNNIIAEIKKSSPSAGIIIKNYFPELIASNYEKSGVVTVTSYKVLHCHPNATLVL